MTVEVGGAGTLGVGFEATLGTYIAPTKWIPIRSESLQKVEDKIWRTNIRGVADRSGAIQGYTHVEGDIEFEVTPESLLYFIYAMRVTCVKTGAGPYTYTFAPAHVAKTTTATGATNRKTLSMLINRGGNPRGYVGLSVGQLSLTVDNGLLMATATMIGTDEATQTAGTPTWPTTEPIGPGDVTLEVPTGTARGDADTFTFMINDNLTFANRLNGQRKAAYNNWGEREITWSYEFDYDTQTDYDAFIAQTIRSITMKGTLNANEEVTVVTAATASESHVTNLTSLGDVNRATVDAHAFHNTGDAFSIVVKTAENIT